MEQGEALRMRRRLARGPSLRCCRTLSGKERFWCIGREPGYEPEFELFDLPPPRADLRHTLNYFLFFCPNASPSSAFSSYLAIH